MYTCDVPITANSASYSEQLPIHIYFLNTACKLDMDSQFQFGPLPKVKCDHLEKSATQDLLSKWSMKDGMIVQAFHFDRQFKVYLIDEFIKDFFGNVDVISHLRRFEGYQFSPIGLSDVILFACGIQAECIKYHKVQSTLTSTEIFDRLQAKDDDDSNDNDNGSTTTVVRPSGTIIKCLPEYFQPDPEIHDDSNPIEIGDELRKLLLKDFIISGGNYGELEDIQDIFTPEEKDEFLYRLFFHFVVGGSLCQYEDTVTPYIDMARSFYKDLMTIGKVSSPIPNQNAISNVTIEKKSAEKTSENCMHSEDEDKIVIKSTVIKITSLKNQNYKNEDLLFSSLHINNFFYLIIQPEEHTVYTLYHHVL